MHHYRTQQPESAIILALIGGPVLIAIGLAWFALSGCAAATEAGWRTTAGVMHASDTTGRQLAQLARSKVAANRSGLSAAELRTCREWRGHLEQWQRYARPAIRSGVAMATSVLRVRESVGRDPGDWLTPLRLAGCGLWRPLQAWGHLLPDQGRAALSALSPLGSALCADAPRARASTAGQIVGIGLEIFGWLTRVIGAPVDKLQAEISAWLASLAADETEPALQALRERCP